MSILKSATSVAMMTVIIALTGCKPSSENSGGAGSDQGSGSSKGQEASTPVAPDNTGRNTRDRSDTALTPGDQGQSESDLMITRRIRRALTSNDQLSTDAKNIKVLTTNGRVTLRGPVKNQQDLETIRSILQQAGVTAIDNQLEIKETNQEK
jgi:hyperosmotically inducible periplasmic protein